MSAPRTLTFYGGAATTTGSMILLEAAGARVLLDAGQFEGDVELADAKNRELPLDPKRLDAVILSQAGLAYAGRTPQLVRNGYSKPIYTTPGTRDLAAVVLAEGTICCAEDQRLYELDDVIRTHRLMTSQSYGQPVHLRRNLVFEFADAGHILGSASIELRTGEGGSHRMVYSGCVGRPGSTLFPDATPLPGPVDTLIIGGPFSHARHPMFADAQQHLADRISAVFARGGHMVVPAASVGPVHEFIRTVQKLFRRGKIPAMPIWLDTPTPVDPGTVLRLHPEALAQPDRAYDGNGGAFDQSLLTFACSDEDRLALDNLTGPAIIIAPSEMGDSGRAAHHLRRCLPDARHEVVLLAFPEEGSVSEQLHGDANEVTIEGEVVPVRATITPMPAYSGHADAEEWRTWIRSLEGPVKRAFVVHGDDLAVAVMVTTLREEGVRDVIVPREGESFAF